MEPVRAKWLAALGVVVASLMASWPAFAGDQSSALTLALANRITWGLSQASIQQLDRLGSQRWLSNQLHPERLDDMPPPIQQQLDAMPIARKSLSQWVLELDAENRAVSKIGDADLRRLAYSNFQKHMSELADQARAQSILRDIYSQRQLQSRMTWFWQNYFSVVSVKGEIPVTIFDYEDQAIRPRALGKFRDLLGAILEHPAMIRYLDNVENNVGHVNENYARELMELHTMGVNSGYSQGDVEQLARILTGVGIDHNLEAPKLASGRGGDLVRDGLFEFNPDRHDYGDKIFLGHVIKGRGFAEVKEALDILSREPATARHVSRAIAIYFVGAAPPERLIDRMARRFQQTDGNIGEVLKILFAAPEFKASLGKQFKDPMQYVISAVRLVYGEQPVTNVKPIEEWIARMGEGLYARQTPDGYPLEDTAWTAPGQMALRFEVAHQIATGSAKLFSTSDATPSRLAPPNLHGSIYFSRLNSALSSPTKEALDQAAAAADWNTLLLSSPEFMFH